MTDSFPKKWQKSNKNLKAMQVAFELEQKIAIMIRQQAAESGLTPSDQIRKLLNLSYSLPKRPRLTVTLTSQDYAELGKRYNINPEDTLSIKRSMMSELIKKSA